MKAYLIDYFWTFCCVCLFDSACKRILVNYSMTQLVRYNSSSLLYFFTYNVFKTHLFYLFRERKPVRILLARTSSELKFYRQNTPKKPKNLEFSEFSAANGSFADVVSEDDVCRAFCIPPIYTKNFDEKHFFLNKSKYFRSLFVSKTT